MFFDLKNINGINSLTRVALFAVLIFGVIFVLSRLTSQPLCKDCNIILVSLDTLSANHLPCYGYMRNTAPNLCSFAQDNIFFENAYTNATWTLPSHASIFTGLYPEHHNLYKVDATLDNNILFLPEYLQSKGYSTYAFMPVGDPSLPIKGVYEKFGSNLYNSSEFQWDVAIDMFKQSVSQGKKTMMFLHTYDVHSPYLVGDRERLYPPFDDDLPNSAYEIFDNFSPEFIEYFVKETRKGVDNNWFWKQDPDKAREYFAKLEEAYPNYEKYATVLKSIKKADPDILWDFLYYFNYKRKIDPQNVKTVDALRARYDQTINILDETKIPLVTNLIEDPKYRGNTILIFTSDHGEEFMEHGHLYHESTYNPNLKVPIIMYVPGLKRVIVKDNVQLVDLVPTILDITGDKTRNKFDGLSLVSAMLGNRIKDRVIVSDGKEWSGKNSKTIVYNDWKLFLSLTEDGKYVPYELYNISKDAGETNNVLYSNDRIKETILNAYNKQ